MQTKIEKNIERFDGGKSSHRFGRKGGKEEVRGRKEGYMGGQRGGRNKV